MLEYNPLLCSPTPEDLPYSDETPVDNELQDLIPHLLKAILARVWADRRDWFFGIDMGIVYNRPTPTIVPDAFLALGVVRRFFDENLRTLYDLAVEKSVSILALEVVSEHYRSEYGKKKEDYKEMGVLYYAIYNPLRRQKSPLEVHRLVDDEYVLLAGNPIWLPEIGLGIGCERGTYQGIMREWLYWYDEDGKRLLTPEEQAAAAEEQAAAAARRAQILAEQLRALGIDPDSLF